MKEKESTSKRRTTKTRALSAFAIMVGLVDGFYGAGTTDKMARDLLEGKENEEIVKEIIEKNATKAD